MFLLSMCILKKCKTEYFNSDRTFDDILDKECSKITDGEYPNYVWDKYKENRCEKQICEKERCWMLKKNNCNKGYIDNDQELGYYWGFYNSSKKLISGTTTCESKHDVEKNILCSTETVEDMNERASSGEFKDICKTDTCYELEENEWVKYDYINIMDNNGNVNWRQVNNLQVVKDKSYMDRCKKEPFSCASSNYKCCETHNYRCKNNIYDQTIRFEPDYRTEPYTCVQQSECDINKCDETQRHVCWRYNTNKRRWERTDFKKTFFEDSGICEFYNKAKDEIWSEDMENVCTHFDNNGYPPTTQECANSYPQKECGFITSDGSYTSKIYSSKLDRTGEKCEYETSAGDSYIRDSQGKYLFTDFKGGLQYYHPKFLVDSSCPILTSFDCPDSNQYLQQANTNADGTTTDPQCKFCNNGYFRNTSPLATDHSSACEKEKECITNTASCVFDDIGETDCDYCLVRDSQTLYSVRFLPQKTNKNECIIDSDYTKDCIKNPEDATFEQLQNLDGLRVFNNEYYYINCPNGKEFDIDTLECKKRTTCTGETMTCLDEQTMRFKDFIHEKKVAGKPLSECVIRNVDTGNTTDICFQDCPAGYIRNADVCYKDPDYTYDYGYGYGGLTRRETVEEIIKQDMNTAKYSNYYFDFSSSYNLLTYIAYKIPNILNEKINIESIMQTNKLAEVVIRKLGIGLTRRAQTTLTDDELKRMKNDDDYNFGDEIEKDIQEYDQKMSEHRLLYNNALSDYQDLKRTLTYYLKVKLYIENKQLVDKEYMPAFWDELLDVELDKLDIDVNKVWGEDLVIDDDVLYHSLIDKEWFFERTSLSTLPEIITKNLKMYDSYILDEYLNGLNDTNTDSNTVMRSNKERIYEYNKKGLNLDLIKVLYNILSIHRSYFSTNELRDTIYNPPILPTYHDIMDIDKFNEDITKKKRLTSEKYFEGFIVGTIGSHVKLSFKLNCDTDPECTYLTNLENVKKGSCILVRNDKVKDIEFVVEGKLEHFNDCMILRFLVCADIEKCDPLSIYYDTTNVGFFS